MSEVVPVVGVVMGSSSDWEVMRHAVEMLVSFDVPHEFRVVSAHRMPDEMFDYAQTARSRGLRAIIAGAGGAAHLPGMIAAKTIVPVYGVPVPSKYLRGEDSLLSIGLWSNMTVFIGIAALLLLQLGFIYLPFMNAIFGSLPLAAKDLLVATAVGMIILPVISFEKMLRNRLEAREA